MQIRVKLFATLSRYAPVDGLAGTPFFMEVQEDTKLGDLAELLKFPADLVKVSFVNGIIQPPDWGLKPGDDVGIFPPIGGG
jgi:sulfur-carrier protein